LYFCRLIFMKKRKNIHFSIFYFLLILAVGSIPFTKFLLLPITLLLFLNFIVEGAWKEKLARLKNPKVLFFMLLFVSFYLLYCIGLFYSSNWRTALSSLECKLILFIAPIVILSSDISQFTQKKVHFLWKVFIFSSSLLIITNLAISLSEAITFQNYKLFFFYSKLSHFMHPSYSAMHITIALAFSLYFLFFNKQASPRWETYFLYATLPLFFIYIILLQSKAGILILGFLIFIFTLFYINRKKRYFFRSFIFILAVLLAGYFVIFKFSAPFNRLHIAWEAISTPKEGTEQANDGTSLRLAVWQVSFDLGVKNLPFGVGTGDTNDELVKRYREDNMTYVLKKELNAHNQYLQTFLALGILGILLLLAHFIIPLIYAVKYRQWVYIIFIITILLNFLVESMLERRDGTNFIAIFNALFCYLMIYKHDKEEAPSYVA